MRCWLCKSELTMPSTRLVYFVWSDAVQALIPFAPTQTANKEGLGRCDPPRP